MSTDGSTHLKWFKSTYSSGEGGTCVEVAVDRSAIHIRDSKHRTGPQLAVTPTAWVGFVAHVGRAGRS